MEKVFGATVRNDQLIVHGTGKAVLIYGYGEEDGQGFDYRHVFDHKPTKEELKNVIEEHINSMTDEKILTGYVWNGKPVWLSKESQFNFKAAYDLAVQKDGANLPVKFKLGEDENHKPVYHTFKSFSSLDDFYTSAITFINQTLNEGWAEKDNVDYNALFGVNE